MKLYDFFCPYCDYHSEELVDNDEKPLCPNCGSEMKREMSKLHWITNIVPSYPGCKKQKAGHVHTHCDKDATRIQSGYGGCQGPKPGSD